MDATPPQLELDRQLCFALYAASRAVTRAYGPLLDDLGITYPQYVTMLVLWEHPEEQLTVGEIGKRLHLDSGTLTPLLKRLEGLGLLRRDRDAADERRVLIRLTSDGLGMRDRAEHIPGELFGQLELAPAEALTLFEQLTGLAATLEASES